MLLVTGFRLKVEGWDPEIVRKCKVISWLWDYKICTVALSVPQNKKTKRLYRLQKTFTKFSVFSRSSIPVPHSCENPCVGLNLTFPCAEVDLFPLLHSFHEVPGHNPGMFHRAGQRLCSVKKCQLPLFVLKYNNSWLWMSWKNLASYPTGSGQTIGCVWSLGAGWKSDQLIAHLYLCF